MLPWRVTIGNSSRKPPKSNLSSSSLGWASHSTISRLRLFLCRWVTSSTLPSPKSRLMALTFRKDFSVCHERFSKHVFEGAIVPLTNSDGERFNGTIVKIDQTEITVDLNHPLAGKELNFVGQVTESREATNEEIQQMAQMLSGERGCGGCGGGCGSGCGDNCGEAGCGGCGGCNS